MNAAFHVRALPGRILVVVALITATLVGRAGAEVRTGDTRRSAVPSALPKVRLIATGGTISNGDGGRLAAEDLVKSIPAVRRFARPEFEQFSNIASGELTLAQWLQLARRINRAFAEDGDLAGIVVTSGTDTLEETAYFLNLTVTSPKPVVVVGSMRGPGTPGYDGAGNLLAGFRVAATPASRDKGVLVVLNDEINAAREVAKTDAVRLDTFKSREAGILGVVDSDRVVYYRDPVKRHTSRTEFDVSSIQALPRVDVILVYQDAPGDLIKAAVDLGAKGIVMATAGAGAISGTEAEGLAYAAQKGVFIVTSTRTGSGRIARGASTQRLASDRGHRGLSTIAAEDLAPVKARILLMLALTRTTNRDEIQRMFEEY